MFVRIQTAALAAAFALFAAACGLSSSAEAARGDGGGGTSRSCLSGAAQALLNRIESKFGAMQIVSTCRPGATIAGSGRVSKHASGNAIDFEAGGRKGAVINWLVANHHSGGTMTYGDMSHIHVDIGQHFVSLAGGRSYASNDSGSERRRTRARSQDNDNNDSGSTRSRRRSQTQVASNDDDSGSRRSGRSRPMEGYMGLGGRSSLDGR